MQLRTLVSLSTLAVAAAPVWGQAGAAPPAPAASQPAAEQVIVPRVQRRDVKRPEYPSSDLGLGLYVGSYATQNFGASLVSGFRLSYHVTEDVFVDATVGRTKINDESFRSVLPGGVFANRSETLTYYALSAGYNVLPGEAFFGSNTAKVTQGYLLAGVGNTEFAGRKHQTLHAGFGLRLVLADWLAVQADVRNHVFSSDLLGKRQRTQNVETSFGLTLFF